MKIVVFVKQVPDTTDVKLDPKTGNLQRDGVQSIMNEMDAHALEAALQIKSKTGGTVAVVSMGPPQAEDVLKKAMAMGADEGYLLSDRAFGGADTLATAYVLSKACEKIGDCDLFIAGKSASDGETAQTGPIIAAYLGVPQISLADSLEVVDGLGGCYAQNGKGDGKGARKAARAGHRDREYQYAQISQAAGYHEGAEKDENGVEPRGSGRPTPQSAAFPVLPPSRSISLSPSMRPWIRCASRVMWRKWQSSSSICWRSSI